MLAADHPSCPRLRRGRRQRLSPLCAAASKMGPRAARGLGRGGGRCVQGARASMAAGVSISCLRRRRARLACSRTAPAIPPSRRSQRRPLGAAGTPQARMAEGRRDILFVGNMGYLPNIDAAMWFATRIWPRLRPALPFPCRFVIGGNGAPREVMQLGRRPGIALAGQLRGCRAALPPRCARRRADQGGGRDAHQAAGERQARGADRGDTRSAPRAQGFARGKSCYWRITRRDFASSCARLLTDSQTGIAARGRSPKEGGAGLRCRTIRQRPARQDRYMARKGVR